EHRLNALRPAHARGQLIGQLIDDLVYRRKRLRAGVGSNRNLRRVQRDTACRLAEIIGGARHPRRACGGAPIQPPPPLRSRSPSGKLIAPAAVSAVSSPRLWPATYAGRKPSPSTSYSTRSAAIPATYSAGCVLAVCESSASGPSQHSRES